MTTVVQPVGMLLAFSACFAVELAYHLSFEGGPFGKGPINPAGGGGFGGGGGGRRGGDENHFGGGAGGGGAFTPFGGGGGTAGFGGGGSRGEIGGGGGPRGENRVGDRVGGGIVVNHQNAAKYDAATLKQLNVPELTTDNKNAVIIKHAGKLKLSASSIYNGWPAEFAFDGNPHSSWFTATGDSASHGKKPWIQVTFPADVTVKRVTILGNRDPRWLTGYTILAGTIELFDEKGKRLAFNENDGSGKAYDYDWRLKDAVSGVRSVRFNALGDQGKQNPYDDIAIGEMQID